MKRRLLITLLALVLAVIGTSGVLAYIKRADERAIAGMQAVNVLVAQKKIPSGTTASTALREGLLSSQKLPASSVPADALASISPAQSALAFSADVAPGQLLLRPMLVVPTHVTGGLAIPPGDVAVAVHFCVPEAVAGDIQAGAQIAVFDTVVSNASQVNDQGACQGPHEENGNARTRLVLPRVTVLSVGASASAANTASGGSAVSAVTGQQSSGMLLTVAVSQADAEQLIQITETGLPYLALLTTSSHTSADAGHLLSVRPPATPAARPSPSSSPFPTIGPLPTPTPTTHAPSPAPSPHPRRARKH